MINSFEVLYNDEHVAFLVTFHFLRAISDRLGGRDRSCTVARQPFFYIKYKYIITLQLLLQYIMDYN